MSPISERDKMLDRAREALAVPAPQPEPAKRSVPPGNARDFLPRVGRTAAEQLDQFMRTAVDLKAEVVLVENRAALAAALKRLAADGSWKAIASHAGELTGWALAALGLPAMMTDGGYDVHQLEKCDAGITQCDALVAQTGSVLITARSAGGRALSVLPPHHVVIAKQSQLVAGLPDAFGLLRERYGHGYPSLISFITGPSRTGDIERILVLGAHGPKRLTILVLAET